MAAAAGNVDGWGRAGECRPVPGADSVVADSGGAPGGAPRHYLSANLGCSNPQPVGCRCAEAYRYGNENRALQSKRRVVEQR